MGHSQGSLKDLVILRRASSDMLAHWYVSAQRGMLCCPCGCTAAGPWASCTTAGCWSPWDEGQHLPTMCLSSLPALQVNEQQDSCNMQDEDKGCLEVDLYGVIKSREWGCMLKQKS